MNSIHFSSRDLTTDNYMHIKDFRKVDLMKSRSLLANMYSNIKEIDESFEYSIDWERSTSQYLADSANYYDRVIIKQKHGDFSNETTALIPALIDNNYFILNGSTYVPLLFLEKAPIDRIFNEDDGKDKIFINLNAVYNFTFDFQKGSVHFRSKQVSMDVFFRVFFQNDPDYLHELKELGLISKLKFTREDQRKFVKGFLDFYKWENFNDIDVPAWMDRYLLLDYYREIFNDYYSVDNLFDIIKKVIEYYVDKTIIDMADLHNRRVVLTEYLIRPLLEMYIRLLYGIVDKKGQNFLPTLNEYAVMTTGFNKLLHRGQLYDISLPFALPLINKVSQDIQIIKQGRLPKSWQRNDKSSFGRICPITVSPQNMGSNLVFTSTTLINKYGKIKF